MSWRESCAMDERVSFIADQRTGLWTMTELCEHYEISRKTGYKWLERYRLEGAAGLVERASESASSPRSASSTAYPALRSRSASSTRIGHLAVTKPQRPNPLARCGRRPAAPSEGVARSERNRSAEGRRAAR